MATISGENQYLINEKQLSINPEAVEIFGRGAAPFVVGADEEKVGYLIRHEKLSKKID